MSIVRTDGPDCDLPDSLQQNCAHITLRWPVIQQGPELLKQQVHSWTLSVLTGMLDPALGLEGGSAYTIDSAVQVFVNLHREWINEAPASAVGNFAAECMDTLLFQSDSCLTIQLNGYTYTGGAHGLPVTAVQSFSVLDGRQLHWPDLVTDTVQLQLLAEKKFRAVRSELFEPDQEGNPGFEFDETFPFKLPDNYGLVAEGVLLYYNHYEVTPYAFGPTSFVLSRADLSAIIK